jgi:hypothetical protein
MKQYCKESKITLSASATSFLKEVQEKCPKTHINKIKKKGGEHTRMDATTSDSDPDSSPGSKESDSEDESYKSKTELDDVTKIITDHIGKIQSFGDLESIQKAAQEAFKNVQARLISNAVDELKKLKDDLAASAVNKGGFIDKDVLEREFGSIFKIDDFKINSETTKTKNFNQIIDEIIKVVELRKTGQKDLKVAINSKYEELANEKSSEQHSQTQH